MESICLVRAVEHRSSKTLRKCLSKLLSWSRFADFLKLIFALGVFVKMFSKPTDSCSWSSIKSAEGK